MVNWIKINSNDNVAVAINSIKAGEILDVDGRKIVAVEEIPAGHILQAPQRSADCLLPSYPQTVQYSAEDTPSSHSRLPFLSSASGFLQELQAGSISLCRLPRQRQGIHPPGHKN